VRRLVVTGDDFGFSSAVNRAILQAHRHGILTNASLMVSAAASEEAVAIARAHPTLAVGLHLVLADGRSTLPASAVPHLVDGLGRFRGGPARCGWRYAWDPASRRELPLEIRAQLQKFRETGLPLSHVDGHHHLHLHPFVLGILLDLSSEFRIPSIRVPAEELLLTLAINRSGLAAKLASSGVFRLLRLPARARLRAAEIGFADRVYGLLATGRITENYLLHIIPRIRAGRVEIYSHPGMPAQGGERNGPPGAGPRELSALVSPRVREALESSGFVLGSQAGAGRPACGQASRKIVSEPIPPRFDFEE
jgi:hopanoid biosynthesis associated protein HpnK